MDWNNLHILVVVAREGSLAGAARALGVNHATISRHLAALEEELGTGLVRRLSRSTPLTEKGREFLALAQEVEAKVKQVERLASLKGSGVSGTIRLSAPPAFLSESLMPHLAFIADAHPELRMVFVAETRITSLEQGHADIAVRLTEPTFQQGVVRKLGEVSYSLFGTLQNTNRPRNEWRFIGFDQAMKHLPLYKWLDEFAGGRPCDFVSNDFHVQKAAAEAGLGIALLPDRIANQSASLARANTRKPKPQTAWLVIHPDVRHLEAVRVVADAIVNVFASSEDSGR